LSEHKRGFYPSGHEFPDYILKFTNFSDSFDELPDNYETLVEELERIADGRELQFFYICERMSD
jgi:hypothetical protein